MLSQISIPIRARLFLAVIHILSFSCHRGEMYVGYLIHGRTDHDPLHVLTADPARLKVFILCSLSFYLAACSSWLILPVFTCVVLVFIQSWFWAGSGCLQYLPVSLKHVSRSSYQRSIHFGSRQISAFRPTATHNFKCMVESYLT